MATPPSTANLPPSGYSLQSAHSGTADADDVEDGDVMPDRTSWGYRLLALEPHRLDAAFGDASTAYRKWFVG